MYVCMYVCINIYVNEYTLIEHSFLLYCKLISSDSTRCQWMIMIGPRSLYAILESITTIAKLALKLLDIVV